MYMPRSHHLCKHQAARRQRPLGDRAWRSRGARGAAYNQQTHHLSSQMVHVWISSTLHMLPSYTQTSAMDHHRIIETSLGALVAQRTRTLGSCVRENAPFMTHPGQPGSCPQTCQQCQVMLLPWGSGPLRQSKPYHHAPYHQDFPGKGVLSIPDVLWTLAAPHSLHASCWSSRPRYRVFG